VEVEVEGRGSEWGWMSVFGLGAEPGVWEMEGEIDWMKWWYWWWGWVWA